MNPNEESLDDLVLESTITIKGKPIRVLTPYEKKYRNPNKRLYKQVTKDGTEYYVPYDK